MLNREGVTALRLRSVVRGNRIDEERCVRQEAKLHLRIELLLLGQLFLDRLATKTHRRSYAETRRLNEEVVADAVRSAERIVLCSNIVTVI
jgi:hypothetical protein